MLSSSGVLYVSRYRVHLRQKGEPVPHPTYLAANGFNSLSPGAQDLRRN